MGPGVKGGHFLIWMKEPNELGATLAVSTNELDYSHKAPHLWLLREGKGKEGDGKGRRELELTFLCGNHFSRRDPRLPACHWLI